MYSLSLLQAISRRIYDSVDVPSEISDLRNYLRFPEEYQDFKIDISRLSFFKVGDRWLNRRVKGLLSEIDGILSLGWGIYQTTCCGLARRLAISACSDAVKRGLSKVRASQNMHGIGLRELLSPTSAKFK